jgi:ATP-dependent DNA helicase DinG
MKYRQGVGRLIRTAADRGIVTILDARVLAKSYGRLFLGCLPVAEHSRLTMANRDTVFQPFN